MSKDLRFADIATVYARDVIKGKITAGQLTIKACQRHINDLKRQNTDQFPFIYNPLMHNQAGHEYRPADRVCKFIELLPHVKGKWARERKLLTLEPWQIFGISEIFGWIHRETALRRFKMAYWEIARKNAKTTIAAGIALYMLVLDDEAGAEVVSAATSADQSRISWAIAKTMVQKSTGMQKRFGVEALANAIVVESTASNFKFLSSDHKTLDGLNVSAGLMDEVHAMRSREVWDVIETATGSREQPLIIGITTAGSNRAGICYEQRDYVVKILNNVSIDESYFGLIYTIDENDDWTNPGVWEKANPNLGVSVNIDDLQRLCDKAKVMISAQNNFKTKRLNVWVNADSAWLNMIEWKKCSNINLNENDFQEFDCWVGLDLASKIDLAALVRLYRKEIDGKYNYYLFGNYYLPQETIEQSKNDQYAGWAQSGLITVTPGNVIDYEYIEDDLIEITSTGNVQEIAFDPFQATQLSTRMISEGLPMVEMRPTVLNFSEPMKELESLILQGRFHHDGNNLFTWMISNVVAHLDKKDNIYPNKERPENKIDGPVALIMALGRAIKGDIEEPSVYEKRGIITA